MNCEIRDCRLYAILDLGYVTAQAAPRVLEQMLLGGIDIVQLRAKNVAETEIAAIARQLLPLARSAGVPFLLNDHPRLAAEIGADGAHVGQDDLPVSETRYICEPGRIIGKSTHSLAQATAAVATAGEKPDYIGFGPLFATPTKPDYPPIGTEEIRRVHELVPLPVFCIGGIKLENLDAVVAAGARRVVIVSGILQAPDIAGYCREVKAKLQ